MGTAGAMGAHAESFPTAPKAEKRESQLSRTLSRKMLLLFILGGGIYARTAVR